MRHETAPPVPAMREELVEAALESYRAALRDMGSSGRTACSASGANLQTSLTELAARLTEKVSKGFLEEISRDVSAQLSLFGERTAEHLKGKAQEVKDLLMMLARTAESVGERDQRYTQQLTAVSTHLRAVANLEDLTQVRASLIRTANELKTCVDQMKQDSQQAIAQLQSKVVAYENRLKETEDLALRDPLTGLPNRLHLERWMEFRAENGQPFCVAFLDLNEFKLVNDELGHDAGDSLLKQFSDELKANVRPSDVVGRWGATSSSFCSTATWRLHET